MQITCPSCGETVPAENINIQQMGAVCPYCDSVFRFELPGDKVKRRKIKPPEKIDVTETDDRLELAFRTNFRLDKDETFLTGVLASGIFTLLTFFLLSDALAGEITFWGPAIIIALTLFLYYSVALMTFNRTHIEVFEDRMEISRRPLPSLRSYTRINLHNIKSVHCEETPVSKREGYDTPRYNVWAQTVDGSRKMIVSDVIQDYAIFIVQELNSYFDLQADSIQTQLVEDDFMAEDEPYQRNTGVR